MSLEPGRMLAHYRLVEKIGEGGMGVVWKAIDTTLDRPAAIKILPEAFARDPERIARFEREARLLATLSHPGIAAIYGAHEADGNRFIAMELVPGEDLSARIARGALPIDEALDVARRLAEALETAHDSGVLHRDLKPANVKLCPDGSIKILDFGLAKALGSEGSPVDASLSPTITQNATKAGVILGTVAYLSPEQAKGKPADRRSDIWAFGCVLYEMLTGRRPHRGDTISEILAAVLRDDADLGALPPETSAAIRRLLGRCLDRDLRTRLQSIAEARIAIEKAQASDASEDEAPEGARGAARPRIGLASAAALLLAGVAIGALAARTLAARPAPELRSPRTFEEAIQGREFGEEPRDTPPRQAISPDGKWIAYTAGGRLWLRNLSEHRSREVPGSEGARGVFWSPRSDAVGFAANGKILKFAVDGMDPVALCSFSGGDFSGGAWSASAGIVFTLARGNWDGEVLRVPEQGGPSEPFTKADDARDERRLLQPYFLPDGKTLLYSVVTRNANNGEIAVDRGGVRTFLDLGNGSAQAAWSPTGHLIFTRTSALDSDLWALPFSLESLTATGEPFRIVEGGAGASVAADGTVLYELRNPEPEQLVWVDRSGREMGTLGEPLRSRLWCPAVAPDGNRVAAGTDWSHIDVWDSERRVRVRVTGENEMGLFPSWIPATDEIAYMLLGKKEGLMARRADGSGEARALLERRGVAAPNFSPDGMWMAFYTVELDTARDLWAMRLDPPGEPSLLLGTKANEAMPQISPDGTLIAYQSDASGRWEVYLQPFPGGEGRWQVSTNGGLHPKWNPRGGELFFVSGGDLMSVSVSTKPEVRIGAPVELFAAKDIGTSLSLPRHMEPFYDVGPDGDRFVIVKGVAAGTSDLVIAEGLLRGDGRADR